MSVKFKIRSNPYEQKTVFYRYDNSINDYISISKETDPDSKLVSDYLANSFFSIKAKEILKEIDKQFSNGDSIEITFEGSYDDYVQLRDIIDNSDLKNKFKLKNGEKKLYRGAEVLDEIILIFKQIEPLVRDFKVEQIEKNIKSFTDASSNIIPVCVIGNVSVGKSTFINSLIGKEILPCGDEPVTAKIYKIAQSKNEDIAEIKFYYYDEEVRLRFERDQYEFLSEPLSCEFIKDLKSEIERIREFSKDVDNTVSNLLRFVNNYEKNYMKENEERHISDLIELKVFFKSEELRKCNNPIVFFDTPGSNSASNKKHFEVLRSQLNDLSNGLPIYVSTSSSLDTNDNQVLIDFINAIPQLDKRFTMIVVNRADDTVGLKKNAWTEEKQAEVLGETVPRELYSYGLLYVSGSCTKMVGK